MTIGGDDSRFVAVQGKDLEKCWQLKGMGKADFANKAELDLRVVRKLVNKGLIMPRHIPRVCEALNLTEDEFSKFIKNERSVALARKGYTWDDFKRGAEKIATHAFGPDFFADTILTFPSTSLVFVGLVLAMLPPGDAIRTEVYTTILRAGRIRRAPDGYALAPADQFTILVPRAALRDPSRRIVVIDDFITSGGAMEALRRFFHKRDTLDNIRFACCICYDGLASRPDKEAEMPKFIGLNLIVFT